MFNRLRKMCFCAVGKMSRNNLNIKHKRHIQPLKDINANIFVVC